MIGEVVGYKGKIAYDTTRSDGALQKVGDIKKMKSVLHWEPQVAIRDGILRTLDWFAENYAQAIGT
jgi:nucleoside-diphosphate-sugar epimerase